MVAKVVHGPLFKITKMFTKLYGHCGLIKCLYRLKYFKTSFTTSGAVLESSREMVFNLDNPITH
jgi:RNase P/RNase MRP subunit POP5